MKRVLLLLLITFTLSCCNNNDDNPQNPLDQLPPATQTGANTFGCLINGEPFVVSNTSQQTAIYQGGGVQFGAGGVYIVVLDPFEIGVNYQFMDLGQGQARVRYFEDPNPQLGCHYEYNDTYQGTVRFTKIDTVNYIISGTFEFSSVTDNCENINITNGRFDLQYIP
ncbi:MAG TPA: hypothetical protein P5188_04690 [Flavobacterium sp.]|mgnify:FL=1|nr:hypothetical protein [Flavobacterium sp.]